MMPVLTSAALMPQEALVLAAIDVTIPFATTPPGLSAPDSGTANTDMRGFVTGYMSTFGTHVILTDVGLGAP